MAVVGGPGQMLGKTGGVQPCDQMFEAGKVVGIQSAFATDRQADAMHRNGEAFSKVAQLGEGAAAVAHVVLGMDFQPAQWAGVVHDIAIVLGFVSNAGTRGKVGMWGRVKHRGHLLRRGR